MKLIDFVNLPKLNYISLEQVTSLNKDITSKTIEEINKIVPNHKKQMLDEYLTNFLNVTLGSVDIKEKD
jgi:hypothetical protein